MKRLVACAAIFSSGLFLAGCGGGSGGGGGCTNATTGADAKWVASALTVPTDKTMFAMDLNGDGKPDNQLGNIVGALAAQMLNPQTSVDQAIQMGQVVLLLDETADSLTTSSCGSVTVAAGQKTATPPKFDGTDHFTVDSSVGGGTFKGGITGGKFNSNSPVTATDASEVVMTVQIPLVQGSNPIGLKINGAHLQFTNSGTQLMNGQINGGIKSSDVQMTIIPSVAQLLTSKVMSGSGMMSTNQQILDIFDTGGSDSTPPSGCTQLTDTANVPKGSPTCKNTAGPDIGQCAQAGDKVISTCEVATNSIIKNVLAPDVQLFTTDGSHYMPSAANTMKDSLSLGLGFTAVQASY